MKYLVKSFIFMCMLAIKSNCDEFFLYDISSYRFRPTLGNCYEIYNQNEKVTSFTCERQANLEKQFCIDWIPGDKYCLGLKTPTNDTVEFICKDAPAEFNDLSYGDFNNCFNVQYVDQTIKRICQQNFDADSIGITTPDNFTIMFESLYCNTSMSIDERKTLNNFVNSYSFDSGLKSCYKIFNPNQIVSPYTCLNKDVHESCVYELPNNKNCMGIQTQNNETVVLDCAEGGENSSSIRNCFKIYTSDDNVHVACIRKIEPPDCSGTNPKVYAYWLSDINCYGLTLQSNETIILGCTSREIEVEPGCFQVVTSEQEKVTVCARVINELCVGITTPNNLSVVLACYPPEECLPDEYLGQHINWHKKLEDYRLSPVVENCYEIYDQTEKITPFICQRPANYEKHSCIHWISDVDGISGEQEEYCLGLKTPTNETVELICDKTQHEFVSYNEIDLKSCFKVYNIDKIFKTVCQQTFDNFSIGIVTPDNFTVLFGSYFCKTSVSIYNKKVYDNFVNNFSFDPELRSCYKVYKPDQTVSPYTCLNKDVHYSCVHDLPKYKNCVGITTPNNETVILDCSDNSEKLESSGCFKIYTSSNNVHIACQKKLEERCIGITTPSNLTILFECYFCSIPEIRYTRYNIEEQRKHRKFVKSYLTEEYLGRNSYLKNIGFEVFGKNYFIEPPNCDERINSYPYWLPNTDCYALTLNSNETIILECISNDRQAKPGCFKVFSPEKKETTICMEVLGESCLGITTPHNLSVVLTCYPSYTCYTHTDLDIIKNLYAEGTAESFKLYPAIGNCYEVYDEYQEISPDYCKKKSHPENYACIDLIPGKRQCLGLKTPKNETIEFLCSNSTEELLSYNSYINKHCFNIYSPDGRTENICQRKFGNNVIGITTPRNDSILFESYFCRMPKTLDDIKTYREFLRNFIFDPNIRSCYKVYTESQEVSPYTCLNKEVYDACTHPLEDPSCIGITTQNNETVVLHCSNDNRGQDNAGCFKIYTADNIEHSVCQTELEERCIGLITPSNLTMLLECHTCTSPQGESLPSYLDGFRRTHRGFVERALNSYKQDNYSFGDVPLYNVYNPLQEIKENDCFGEISTYFVHLLYGHDNCRGVTLKNFETIVLDCPDKKPDKPGCFNVFSPKYGPNNTIVGPDQQAQNVCVQILNERCVGFITPGNWTIALACNQPRQAACSAINIPNRGSPPRM